MSRVRRTTSSGAGRLVSRYRTRTGDRVTVARSNATITTLQLDRENKYRTHTVPVIQPLSGGMLAHRAGRVIFRLRGWKGWGGGWVSPDIYSFILFNNLLIM